MLIQTFGTILSWISGHPVSWIPLGYLAASAVAFVLYGWDKLCAAKGWWRVRESTLHLCEFLGGWPGAAVAQRVFHHKTVKPSFRAEYHLCIFLNLVLMTYLVWGQTTGDWTFCRFRGLESSHPPVVQVRVVNRNPDASGQDIPARSAIIRMVSPTRPVSR